MLWITLLKIFANRLPIRVVITLSLNCKKNEQLKILTIKQYVMPAGASMTRNGSKPSNGAAIVAGRLCIAHKASDWFGTKDPLATIRFYAFFNIFTDNVNR